MTLPPGFAARIRRGPVQAGLVAAALGFVWLGGGAGGRAQSGDAPRWLAGDHHIHSRYSVGWDRTVHPPRLILGRDAVYSIPRNARMARRYGLEWTVATDHGGPDHSKGYLEWAYPELLRARAEVPQVVQFYGLELNTPGGDHSSLIVPHGPEEAQRLHDLESRFDRQEAYPADPSRDTEAKMTEALEAMDRLAPRPVVIANHPSRSRSETGAYGDYDPAEFRRWNDTAPDVAVGMAGAPGHQAAALNPDRSLRRDGSRGYYTSYPTWGGFDPLTARLGGFWDSMLGEGRRSWITANSDSHVHYSEGGVDFWPGEYSKTYVHAEKSHAAILEGLRRGRVFVTTGDLVSELYLTATSGGRSAAAGGSLAVALGADVEVTIRLRDPDAPNPRGLRPAVARVDLIAGDVAGPAADPARDRNPTARVVRRFVPDDWSRNGEYRTMRYTLRAVTGPRYLRVRGTSTEELEPAPDPRGEDPWGDLWFYSNPVFVEIR